MNLTSLQRSIANWRLLLPFMNLTNLQREHCELEIAATVYESHRVVKRA